MKSDNDEEVEGAMIYIRARKNSGERGKFMGKE